MNLDGVNELHATDIMPVNPESWKETRSFLLNVMEVLLDYIREQYDRDSKILEFHHPAEMQQLIDLSIPEKPMNLGALVQHLQATSDIQEMADVVEETKRLRIDDDTQGGGAGREVTPAAASTTPATAVSAARLGSDGGDSPTRPCLVERGISGVVRWFNPFKGYGFITRLDTDKDVFVHMTAIVRISRLYHALTPDEKVVFDVVQGFKGPEAWCVTAADGNVVKGMRFYIRHYPRTPPRYPADRSRSYVDITPRSRVEQSRHFQQSPQKKQRDDEGSEKESPASKTADGGGKDETRKAADDDTRASTAAKE